MTGRKRGKIEVEESGMIEVVFLVKLICTSQRGERRGANGKTSSGRHGCGGDAGWDIRGGTGRCCKPRVQIIYV